MGTAFDRDRFVWLTGIEDTCVYSPARYGMPPLDEFALTGHDDQWRDDLLLVRDLGCGGLRYGAGWPRVHLAPGKFDWSWLDERIEFANDLGLTIIADLVHYGTATWLDGSFADPDYPEVVAEFAGAFAERYRGMVDAITPLNEPVTTASFSGLRGVWPPALTGWDGWTRVVTNLALGMSRSIAAIRSVNPAATIVHVEASALYETDDPALDEHRLLLERVAAIPTDLLLGRIQPGDEAWRWLEEHGASVGALTELAAAPPRLDILGVNYYPDLTPRRLVAGAPDPQQRALNRGVAGLEQVLRDAERRYGLPMMVTETSIEGSEETRSQWLRGSTDAVAGLRSDGMDIRGYTWWPLIDFVDWSWASGGHNIEEFEVAADVVSERTRSATGAAARVGSITPFLRRMGLARLDEANDGTLRRRPDASAELFASFARPQGLR